MKTRNLFIVLLVICLSGCSLSEVIQPPEDSKWVTTAEPTQQATTTTTISTEEPATTEPTQAETEPYIEVVQPTPCDEDFVKVKAYIPDILIDLRYSTKNNFTNQKIYDFTDAWLRYGTVKKLILVQEELKQKGLYLKIWDGFRPPSAQFKLWDVCPDPTYVSNPNNGFSSHSRGNTVDITLVHKDGTELVMPTGFDDFSKLADRDYSDCSAEAAANAILLEETMKKYGFKPYSGEWWHFSDTQSYPVDESFEPVAAAMYYANCNEYITLRVAPSALSDPITIILAGEQFQVVAQHGDFALVEYNGLTGYVLYQYILPVSQT